MARPRKRYIEQERPQVLYIMQNGNTNEYKIGITGDINRRYKEIQVGCPNELRIVKLWTHYQRKVITKYERVLHNYFKICKIRENGEWYRLSNADIAELCKPNNIYEQNEFIKNCLKTM